MQELAHESKIQGTQRDADPTSTPLSSVPVLQPADDRDDDPDEIFLTAIAQTDTQPLPTLPQSQGVCWPLVCLTVLLLVSFAGGTAFALLTYPTVTIDVVPVSKSITWTTSLALPTRALAPVTLTKAETVPTTGTGHQDARAATGSLTLYNGLFTTQSIPTGTVFTGADGIKVATEAAVTIPAGNPPSYGQASVDAQALQAGSTGNIAAGDISTTVSSGVLVKNGPFSGGRDARSFQAVAQADLDHVTSTLQNTLSQQFPPAFALRPGEAVQPTNCTFNATPNHRAGDEAQTVTVHATETCTGIAYNSEQMNQQATVLFRQQTAPGTNYQLMGKIQVQLVSMAPLIVLCHGLWVSILSPDYEQFLAQQIAGDSPQQARKYLLETGFLTRAMVPDKLPPDPAHIHFQMLIGI
ncbi:MAG: baseplate J/gp47 family protein [Ktedonobacteraceae bacterium]